MRWNELEDQACSLARTVSVIGDRWTLLILRDCFLRVRRFEEFQARLGVTRPILASRLRKLVKDFVLAKVPYQERPLRYEYRLTQKGLDLYPTLVALMQWGDAYLGGEAPPPVELRHRGDCDAPVHLALVCDAGHHPGGAREVRAVTPGAASDTA